MAHTLIIGRTLMGKTYLAKELCRQYKSHSIQRIVLDPLLDPGWQAEFITKNPDEFLAVAKESRSCALFIDESAQTIGRYAREMKWCATTSRHWGHKSHFIAHRFSDLDKTVRDQCSTLYIFHLSFSDAKLLADEYTNQELKKVSELKKYEFFRIDENFNIKLLTLKK